MRAFSCVVTYGHVTKMGDHTIESAIAENPVQHVNRKPELLQMEFLQSLLTSLNEMK